MSEYKTGKVRFFNDKKGRGYITSDNGDLYEVHYSAIVSDSTWKTLKENTEVKFIPFDDPEYKIVKTVIITDI